MIFNELVQFIKQNDNFLLISHADPDGDAVGSEYALLQVLKAVGKRAMILNADQASSKFSFYDTDHEIHSLEEGFPIPSDLAEKTLLLLDTSDFQHTGRAQDLLIPHVKRLAIVDHHSPKENALTLNAYVDVTAAATCQIVYELLEALKVPLVYPTAMAIFMGLVYDTGSFIYPKTSPRTFEIAMKLTQAGVKPKEIHSNLYETIEPSRMKLLAQVQSTMRFFQNDTIAVQNLSLSMLEDSGASLDDSDNFINYPLKCTTVLVSVLVKEVGQGHYRCSLRSKGEVDISRVAMQYGGGGHKNAAGFPCPDMPLDQFMPILLELLQQRILEGSS